MDGIIADDIIHDVIDDNIDDIINVVTQQHVSVEKRKHVLHKKINLFKSFGSQESGSNNNFTYFQIDDVFEKIC